MKNKFCIFKGLLIINQIIILYWICKEYLKYDNVKPFDLLPVMMISILIIGAEYIYFNNIKENKNLFRFANLLLLIAWGFLISRFNTPFTNKLSTILSIFIPYQLIKYIWLFVFQGKSFKYQEQAFKLLKISYIITFCSMFITGIFYKMILINWLIDFICGIVILVFNIKPMIFIIKKQYKHIGKIVIINFIVYTAYMIILEKSHYSIIEAIINLIIIIPIHIIYTIIETTRNQGIAKETSRTKVILGMIFVITIGFISKMLKINPMIYFVIGHSIALFIMIYYFTEYSNFVKIIKGEEMNSIEALKCSSYRYSIIQTIKEAKLKKDFSNYLHDEILQDLLAIKNMLSKVEKPEVKQLIIEILDNLNQSIRAEMQEYHPALLNTISFEENINNLLQMLKEKYKDKILLITLECDKELFLVYPYDLIVYRIIKELVTNIYKHSKADIGNVILSQEKDMIRIQIKDNGIGLKSNEDLNQSKQKGIKSIKQQITMLDGEIYIKSQKNQGICIDINIPMKGEKTYQYFIS